VEQEASDPDQEHQRAPATGVAWNRPPVTRPWPAAATARWRQAECNVTQRIGRPSQSPGQGAHNRHRSGRSSPCQQWGGQLACRTVWIVPTQHQVMAAVGSASQSIFQSCLLLKGLQDQMLGANAVLAGLFAVLSGGFVGLLAPHLPGALESRERSSTASSPRRCLPPTRRSGERRAVENIDDALRCRRRASSAALLGLGVRVELLSTFLPIRSSARCELTRRPALHSIQHLPHASTGAAAFPRSPDTRPT
jgi:hypothetical protein